MFISPHLLTMCPEYALFLLFGICGITDALNVTTNFSGSLPELTIQDGMAMVEREYQEAYIMQALQQCEDKLRAMPLPDENVTVCFRTWDTVACWSDALPGTVLSQPCPNYINEFIVEETATRTCLDDGTWQRNPHEVNSTQGWTDYRRCSRSISPLLRDHVPRITLLYNVGYGVSLVTLSIASFVLLYFKRLYCPRNTLHLHLFLSFMLRAGFSLLRDNLFVYGLGLSQDVTLNQMGHPVFQDIGALHTSHWECKTLTFFFVYFLSANYIWIFNEGLYLHMLIFVSVFSEKTTIMWYIVFGWMAPLTFTLPWAIVRMKLHNRYCWNVSDRQELEWIVKGPLLAFILVNFGFFISIVRVLFTKLKASNTKEGRRYKYKKLAKSTLVLIPLFGVHYILFSLVPADILSEQVEVVKLYFEMMCNSFQGFLVALLYCFLNGEVQGEVKKKWQRFRLQHGRTMSTSSRQSKGVTDTADLMNGHGCSSTLGHADHTGYGDKGHHNQAKDIRLSNRMEKDYKVARPGEEGCGQLLLQSADDSFMSESAITETSCFTVSVSSYGDRSRADSYGQRKDVLQYKS